MWRRQERRRAKLNEAILDGLAEEFDNELAGVEYPVTPELSDRQLASALTLPGMVLASAVVELPPVVGEHHKSEAKRLQKAADDHPERVVALARFLAHAIIAYSITHDEVVTDLSDRLQREPSPPTPIQIRARRALEEHLPIDAAAQDALARAERRFDGLAELTHPDLALEGAFLMRCNDYRAEIAIHGARIVLAEEFRTSRTADRTRFGEALGGVKIGHAWVAAEEEAFEILHRGA